MLIFPRIARVSGNGVSCPALLQGKHDEAEPLLQQAVSITDKVLGKNHPDCSIRLNNLAHLLEKQVTSRASFSMFSSVFSFDSHS